MMDGTMILTGAADRNYDYLARTARVDVAEQDRAARIAQTMDHEYMAAQGESHEVNEGLQRQANIEGGIAVTRLPGHRGEAAFIDLSAVQASLDQALLQKDKRYRIAFTPSPAVSITDIQSAVTHRLSKAAEAILAAIADDSRSRKWLRS